MDDITAVPRFKGSTFLGKELVTSKRPLSGHLLRSLCIWAKPWLSWCLVRDRPQTEVSKEFAQLVVCPKHEGTNP